MRLSQTEPDYRESWKRLYRYAYSRLRNRQEAEDLTQETYRRALAKVGGSGGAPSLPYLFTVALNLLRDRWRRPESRVQQVPLDEGRGAGESDEDQLARRAWVREMMARLPDEYRTVLELRIVQGHSRAEVARRMGRTEDAIRGLQYRALSALRQLSKEESE